MTEGKVLAIVLACYGVLLLAMVYFFPAASCARANILAFGRSLILLNPVLGRTSLGAVSDCALSLRTAAHGKARLSPAARAHLLHPVDDGEAFTSRSYRPA
jgi:hypothetical protein